MGKFYFQISEVKIFLDFFFFSLRLALAQDEVKGTGAALATPKEAKPIPASQTLLGSGWNTVLSPQQVTQGGHSPAAGTALDPTAQRETRDEPAGDPWDVTSWDS